MDDAPWIQVHSEGRGGSNLWMANHNLDVLGPASQSAQYRHIPADPVVDYSATVRTLDWDLVALGGPGFPLIP